MTVVSDWSSHRIEKEGSAAFRRAFSRLERRYLGLRLRGLGREQPIVGNQIRRQVQALGGVQGNRVVGEKPHFARRVGSGELVNRTDQLIVAFLVVQTVCKVRGVRVLGFHGENDARGLGMDDPVGLTEHFPEHGRCGAGAFADTAALGLEAVDLPQHRARYDQPHLFEPVPGRPVELFQRVALDEQVRVHKIIESRSRHDASRVYAMLASRFGGRGRARPGASRA